LILSGICCTLILLINIRGDVTIKESPINRSWSKRGILILIVIFVTASGVIYSMARPQLVPGQKPLTDINHIETLRTQFNRDAGKTRLILLVSPT